MINKEFIHSAAKCTKRGGKLVKKAGKMACIIPSLKRKGIQKGQKLK